MLIKKRLLNGFLIMPIAVSLALSVFLVTLPYHTVFNASGRISKENPKAFKQKECLSAASVRSYSAIRASYRTKGHNQKKNHSNKNLNIQGLSLSDMGTRSGSLAEFQNGVVSFPFFFPPTRASPLT